MVRTSSALRVLAVVMAVLLTAMPGNFVFADQKPVLIVTPQVYVADIDDSFTVTFEVQHDTDLAYLEIDHNLGNHGDALEGDPLPEFKLYPNVNNPWAPESMNPENAKDRLDTATSLGLVASYDPTNTTWALTFGGDIFVEIKDRVTQNADVTNGEFRIYSLVVDIKGNSSGSMHEDSYETTVIRFTTSSPNPGEEPSDPGTDDPSDPGTGEPSDPGADDPSDPGTDEPSDPGTDDPSDPGTGEPSHPGTGSPGSGSGSKPKRDNKQKQQEPETGANDGQQSMDDGTSYRRFTDVQQDDAVAPYVEKLVQAGVLHGYPDGSFQPKANVTRYELAKMLAVVTKLQVSNEPSEHWADNYVRAVVDAGLMIGTGSGFYGDAVVTRAQVATIIGRLLAGKVQVGDLSRFTDAGDIPAWAVDGFAIAVGAGIFEGYPDNTLAPNAPVTREQMAKILALLMDLLG